MKKMNALPLQIIWSVREVRESVEDLLAMLERKDLYLPFLEQISSESRRKEWLAVRVLLKEMLGEEKEILYTEAGKPYLSDNSYKISISHTKGFVAIALHPQKEVGIDIEHISPRIRKIRSRFMNEKEEAGLDKNCEEIHLLLHWSAKESMFKILGEQDVNFRNGLHVDPFKPVLNELSPFSAYEIQTEKQYNFSGYYIANTGYVLTIVFFNE